MEQLVDTLAAYPSSSNLSDSELDKQCRELLTNCLHKVTASNLASPVGGSDILTLLNPQLNSLSYLFVLWVAREALAGMADDVVAVLSSMSADGKL